jgi:capsular polysaccharide transport system permease protein
MQRPVLPFPEVPAPAVPRWRQWLEAPPRLRLLPRSGWLRWGLLLLPSILAALYYGAIATDQYESEARFVVRSANRPEMSGTLSFLVQLGLARSQDDAFIVQDFIGSRGAVERLKAHLPLDRIYGPAGADFLARWPSVLYGPQDEQLYKYLKTMISVVHSERTGISTLKVRAFDAADAKAVAEALLSMSEDLVNRLNGRLQTDAIANSVAEVRNAQERLIAAQTRLTEFQNRELTVDPVRNAVALGELIAHLSAELGVVQAQVAEMKGGTAASPQLGALQRKATALQQQIAEERRRIADDRDGLATRLATYERLQLEREFARRMLTTAEMELVRSRSDAARQMLYLERFVEPHSPDDALEPKSLRLIATVTAANFISILVCWLLVSGLKEHAPHHRLGNLSS